MASVTVYTKDYCPYCKSAKQLLTNKGITFEEIDISDDMDLQLEVVEKSGGRRTVPQIFIGNEPIGGYDDMVALDKEGKLDGMLAA